MTGESLPTIKEIANNLCVDRRTIDHHFPQLCQEIVSKRRKYQHISHLNSLKQCCDEVQKVTVYLYNSGIYPTEARISQLISKPGYLRYKKVIPILETS